MRSASELARDLEALIAALDRRVPRVEQATEAAIARDAAALRAKAVDRLAELATVRPSGVHHAGLPTKSAPVYMQSTPFPTSPCNVAALTVPEFARGLDLNQSVSIDAVCHRFLEDTNRALVWFIRFCALTAWRERPDMAAWLYAEPTHARHACEVAASFELNADWEFDAEPFRSAVESAARC